MKIRGGRIDISVEPEDFKFYKNTFAVSLDSKTKDANACVSGDLAEIVAALATLMYSNPKIVTVLTGALSVYVDIKNDNE